MNNPVSGIEENSSHPVLASGISAHPDVENACFFYASSQGCIQARGIAEAVCQPVGVDAVQRLQFLRSVDSALNRARAYGQKRPLVMGCIPFDRTQPATLYVPRESEFLTEAPVLPVPDLAIRSRVISCDSVPGEQRFRQSVEQAVANFRLSDIRKTVLSRVLNVDLDRPLDAGSVFQRLRAQNPSGYHFRFPLADGSELIGASPELLLRKQGRKIMSNPLAGSARRRADATEDRQVSEQLLRSAKDAYEHKLVIDDIRQVLSPWCEELDIPDAPSLISTPAMWHLSTCIHGQVNDATMNPLKIATELHPTPAVCGSPTAQAYKLIQLIEPYERGPFAGMVGWCDAEGNGEWVVTIRCGRITANRIQIFAGAGIVADSSPESEWAETRAKMQTMLNALDADFSGVTP